MRAVDDGACSIFSISADHDGLPAEEYHEASPKLERYYSAKSEVSGSHEDLKAHGEVGRHTSCSSSAGLYKPCSCCMHYRHVC